MDPAHAMAHAGTWGALNSGRVDGLQITTWDSLHNSWIGKEYVRVTPSNKDCAF
jgi:hypothetical protein